MACPSSHPIDSGTECTDRMCNYLCFNQENYAVYTSKTNVFTRCKNAAGETVCNYITTTYDNTCTCYIYHSN